MQLGGGSGLTHALWKWGVAPRSGTKRSSRPRGEGVLLMPVPELDQLAGIAQGARKDGYRDREDRF